MAKTMKRGKKTARKGRKGGIRRNVRNVGDYASLSETRELTVDGGFVTNSLYSLMNTSLDQFTRAPAVARGYQHYRIKYINLKFKPTFDAYTQANVPPTGKPYLYYMIDKAGSVPDNITLAGLKAMGAKPRAFDEKVLTAGWRPSVLDQVMTLNGVAPQAQSAKYSISPWLSTSASTVTPIWVPNTVDHLGIYWFVDSLTASNQQPYKVEVEVQFEFKKPLIVGAVGQFSALPARPALLNASRDGVVDSGPGGDDHELIDH